MPPLSAEQHEIRRTGLGSSDISAIVGENPYSSPHRVWLEKRGLAERDNGSDATWLGQELEPILGRRYSQELGVEIVPGPGTVRHQEHEWALATTDFEHADGSRIVECKVVGWRAEHHWDDSSEDGFPPYVAAQTQFQMGIRGIHETAIPVLFTSDARFRVFLAKFDERIFRALIGIGGRFWHEHVIPGVPPATDGSDDARKVLTTLYPYPTRALLQAPLGAFDEAIAYMEAKAAEKSAKAAASVAGNKLRKMIGDAQGIEGSWGHVTWAADKTGKRTLRVKVKEAA